MSGIQEFSLGGMRFEIAVCTDPSTETVNIWVYRTDIHPRATVATGLPDYLSLTPDYAEWDVSVIEKAVATRMGDAP